MESFDGGVLVANENLIRLAFFVFVFVAMAGWEVLAPKRTLVFAKASRWLSNLTVLTLNSFLLRLLVPIAATGVAVYGTQYELGLLHWLGLPEIWRVLAAVILLDLGIYAQHVVFHRFEWLWRIHRMHHADQDFDVTTGGRFHPLEIVISMFIKCILVLIVGAPVVAVLVFEILLSSNSMFSHSNIRLPKGLDQRLRWSLVTPDMHRVHHSVEPTEANRNFGFCLPWWDRIFGTYLNQPALGHTEMRIGTPNLRNPSHCHGLLGMLKSPFIEKD